MRVQFIQTESRYKAKKEACWAVKVIKVVGGFMAFESWTDFDIWKNQK